jgi:cytoskeletal protein CcmA (bactofilin family)
VYKLYLVGEQETFKRINDALTRWQNDKPADAVIEITDSGVYVEPINITLRPGQTLQLRAANRKRPVIRLLNWQTSAPDNLTITGVPKDDSEMANGEPTSWFTLDGILVTGRGFQVQGEVAGVVIRHSTLVPGWGLDCNCEPARPTEPSLELDDAPNCVRIEHSILGSIQVNRDEVREDPCVIHISDSIVDATSTEAIAVGAPEKLCAYSVLTIKRSTFFGQVQTHAIELAENSIFMGVMRDCRRQQGCMRFCYCTPGSRTPRRYECQPDLVEQAVLALAQRDNLSSTQKNKLLAREQMRVEPEFNSVRYGTPTYCQLSDLCAQEITRGADDQSEMGVFHDLYQPQRAANLRARLDEYTPAGMTAGIIYAS